MNQNSRSPARLALAVLLAASTAGAARCGAHPAAAQAGAMPAATGTINIPFQHYQLANGLQVILAEDHATPTVAVDIMYHVGSKNEQVGRTGFAHLFEHVMFTGSGHVPYGLHDRLTEGVGGGNNGSTSNDVTTYFETVPSNYLEAQLWLESDRMGWLLDALDTAKYNAQRDIVKNERRQSVDNQPYGRVGEILARTVYPKGHPYSWPVIGSMADLSAASVEDVKNFFRLNYAPNNAVLTIAGDFDPAQARTWVSKYFSEIPQGRPIVRPNPAPVTLSAETRLVLEDRVTVPRLYLDWPAVGMKHADYYALDLLGTILAGPRTARLTKALVYDEQSAASVSAYLDANEDVGDFDVVLTPRPGHTLTELEAATDSIIARLKRDGPTADELQRARAGQQLQFVQGLESNLGKAFQLAYGQVFHNDAGHYRIDYERTQAVAEADIKRVANRYLTGGRVVLSVVPQGRKADAAKPDSSVPVGVGGVQ
ncbi:MAG: insulinase family protein [Gemmatimonadetes bacterium]|nr:insulinase family protein [Gemmatimonadota bacterium]